MNNNEDRGGRMENYSKQKATMNNSECSKESNTVCPTVSKEHRSRYGHEPLAKAGRPTLFTRQLEQLAQFAQSLGATAENNKTVHGDNGSSIAARRRTASLDQPSANGNPSELQDRRDIFRRFSFEGSEEGVKEPINRRPTPYPAQGITDIAGNPLHNINSTVLYLSGSISDVESEQIVEDTAAKARKSDSNIKGGDKSSGKQARDTNQLIKPLSAPKDHTPQIWPSEEPSRLKYTPNLSCNTAVRYKSYSDNTKQPIRKSSKVSEDESIPSSLNLPTRTTQSVDSGRFSGNSSPETRSHIMEKLAATRKMRDKQNPSQKSIKPAKGSTETRRAVEMVECEDEMDDSDYVQLSSEDLRGRIIRNGDGAADRKDGQWLKMAASVSRWVQNQL
jgi:hypothetical protein